jgi:hypothetical protein
MRLPVGDARENGAEQRILPGAGVEGAHQALDHRFVNAGALDDLRHDLLAPPLHAHSVAPPIFASLPTYL